MDHSSGCSADEQRTMASAAKGGAGRGSARAKTMEYGQGRALEKEVHRWLSTQDSSRLSAGDHGSPNNVQ